MREDRAERPIGRLTRRPEFLAAASGRRFHTERMTVQGRLRDDDAGLRIGFTLTKKVGHATERNRIRRRLRDAARAAAPPHATHDADIVVIGRRPALAAPFEALVADLARAFGAVTKPRTETPGEAAPHALSSRKRGKPPLRRDDRPGRPAPSGPGHA